VERAVRDGRLVMLDARQTLSSFMVEGMPDWELFQARAREALARCRQGGGSAAGPPHVRAYGEMVDVLWRDGNRAAALRLEELWNRLGRIESFDLLCAYSMENFRQASDGLDMEGVCRTHSHVVGSEGFDPGGDRDALNRQVALLQQQARALETELSRRKELEEELRQQNEQLSRTVRFSEMFVGILGHDLRNPLSAVVTAAGLLLRRPTLPEVTRPAERILRSAGRMSRMIDQLLDFTHIRLGQGLPLKRQPLDLRTLCQSVYDELDDPDRATTVQIDCVGEVCGSWDSDRLLQLLSNLVGNALTHGVPGRPVSVQIDGRGPTLLLHVHNEGQIPPALQAGLFEPFKPAEDLKQVGSSGLGLGLYISDQIARAHGGDITVVSSVEAGTRFTVRLPRGPSGSSGPR
jgi:signal transduction histidine kinase